MRCAAIVILIVIAGCYRPTPPQIPDIGEPRTFPHDQYSGQADGEVFAIIPGSSEVVIEVKRRGLLAGFFGHDHVIASSDLTGFIDLKPGRADVYLPVASLRVDDAADWESLGGDYRSAPSPDNIEGTWANMLSGRLLDVARFPFITAHLDNFRTGNGQVTASLTVTVKNHVHTRDITLTVQRAEARISAATKFEITHGELGLTPIAILGGTISVDETLRVRVNVHATSLVENSRSN